MSRELLRKSLSWLIEINPDNPDSEQLSALKRDIADELAKPLPEPIGYAHYEMFEKYLLETGTASMACKKPASDNGYKIPLYTSAPEQKPLSDDEIVKGFRAFIHRDWHPLAAFEHGVRFLEQRRGITDQEQSKPQSNAI